MREFETGATRDSEEGKFDYEGFLSPLVLERFAAYMHEHRKQADGKLRDSDNWQKGIPRDAYMKSAWRHFFAWWKGHRQGRVGHDDLCALMFNVMGYLHEELKREDMELLKPIGEAILKPEETSIDERRCSTCLYYPRAAYDDPCNICGQGHDFDQWRPAVTGA